MFFVKYVFYFTCEIKDIFKKTFEYPLCILETTKGVFFPKTEDLDEMQHNAACIQETPKRVLFQKLKI